MKKSSEINIIINSAQAKYFNSRAKYKTNIWGRGTGKSTCIGIDHIRRQQALPQANFFLGAPTYKQVLNNCLAPMEDIWIRRGMLEYDYRSKTGHYVIGQKPPRHFDKPYKPPRNYDNIITFWNGYTITMISMDRPYLVRSGNFDGGDFDETALLKKEEIEQNILPAIRGNADRFGETNPLHGTLTKYTSMPWLASGMWVLEDEVKAKENPSRFYYSEATAHCNLKALGRDWLKNQEEMLSPVVFQVEILNQRKIKADNMFYFNFSEEKHVYVPSISYRDDPTGRGTMVDQSSDYNHDQLIDMSWDFGGWFTGACAFQQSHDKRDSAMVTERMIDSFFVQKGGSAEDVVDQFCNKYSGHRMKYVRIWGEPRANDPSAHGKTLYEKVAERFRKHGWSVEVKVFQSQAHTHDIRYAFINDVLAENKRLPRLRVNRDTCKAPIIAIQSAERTHDLKKDKSKEKDRKFDQRFAPHFTDAVDYYFMQKHYKADQGHGMDAWSM